MFSGFIPNQTYHLFASIISIPLAIFISSLTVYHLKRNQIKCNPSGKPNRRDWFSCPVFGLLWLYLSYIALTIGMPSLLNHVLASKHEQTVTVVKKTKGSPKWGCRHKIHTKELKSVLSKGLCTSQEFYEYIKVGDQLQLTGKKSWLGITVENFHKQK